MSRKIGLIALGAGALALSGCQQETAGPAGDAPAPGNRGYVLEVQNLKAQPQGDFETGLAALEARFGLVPNAAGSAAGAEAPTAGEAEPAAGALGKAAAAQVYSQTRDCSRIFKTIFRVSPGDNAFIEAISRFLGGAYSDPVAMLVRIEHPDFIQNGVIPEVVQAPITILARSDDVAAGDLTSRISYTFSAGQSGHYMFLVFPYSNTHSTRSVGLRFEMTRPACPNCDEFYVSPGRVLGGNIYKSQGANDFRANRVNADGNPRVYVLMNTLGSGMTNGDANYLTRNSRVFPYSVSAAQGSGIGNVILIDNEAAGTASFLHTQYTP